MSLYATDIVSAPIKHTTVSQHPRSIQEETNLERDRVCAWLRVLVPAVVAMHGMTIHGMATVHGNRAWQ